MESHEPITIERSADVLTVAGEVDAHTAPDVLAAASAALDDHRTVRLALGGVEFIDSSGLGVLVALTATARDAGGDLVLISPSRPVVRLLEISGLHEHLTVESP